jgi:4-carboxymuconolactone decarboxylase
MVKIKSTVILTILVCCICDTAFSQAKDNKNALDAKEQSIVTISAYAAKGDLPQLNKALHTGLNSGLTISQIKETLVHLYAYCGFPRSIRGLQTFMSVLDERKSKGITDNNGSDASPITDERSKYQRGRDVLAKLTGLPQDGPQAGYSVFAPQIDTFLKEHLFADIFERDVLTFAQRELVTISVLSSIGGVEPMLQSHLNISLHVGITPDELRHFINIIQTTAGEDEARAAKTVLERVLNKTTDAAASSANLNKSAETESPVFPRGEAITNNNFIGKAYLKMLIGADSINPTAVGNVTFEPGARTNWHMHPGGQILLVIDGVGYYQEKGQQRKILRKGDVIKCPANVPHWHGASADNGFVQVAVTNRHRGETVWMQPVSEKEYRAEEKTTAIKIK